METVNYKMPVNDFLAIYTSDVVNCLGENIKNDWVRLVIRAEPNSIHPDNQHCNMLYDPKQEKILTISKTFSRDEILMVSDFKLIVMDILNCFKQLGETALLLYVAIEWKQYEEQEDGELKYKEFKEVLLDA